MSPPGFTPILLSSDALRAEVLPYGATLADLRFQGGPRSLVLSFEDPQDHARVPIWAGAIAGPVANRVRAGRVEIGAEHYQMPLNEPQASLHSGADGLHAQNWAVAAQSASSVTLTCDLPHLWGGLPGNRHFEVRYRLAETTLRLEITARTDLTTPVNIAAHPYWRLDNHLDITRHRLEIAASTYLPTDAHTLPLDAPVPVAGTDFDFRTPKPVLKDQGLDVNFCLGTRMLAAPRPVARLCGQDGTALEIATTTPGLQVYNGAFLPSADSALRGNARLAPYTGIALEPQHWPDALTHRHFPSILLAPEAQYRQTSEFTLTRP
ncbi:MAG: aldose epimerase family protein [Pseudomonadota bacterium]